MHPTKRSPLDDEMDGLGERIKRIKANVRMKIEYAFRVLNRQFGHVKVCYRGS